MNILKFTDNFDKRILNLFLITILTFITFLWTFWIFHTPFELKVVVSVAVIRMLSSIFIFKDYSLSWSKATQKTFLMKSVVNFVAFVVYMPLFYGYLPISFFISELFLYLFLLNFLLYGYYLYIDRSKIVKDRSMVIYGAGKAGLKLLEEYKHSRYSVKCFIDDDKKLHNRSVDGIKIISQKSLKGKFDLLVIALPSVDNKRVREISKEMEHHFNYIKILPPLSHILSSQPFINQLKNISVEDLLARNPKDLDKEAIENFIKGKKILITGAGGSIGSEISRQCAKYGASELILLDHSEYNLYQIGEELDDFKPQLVMQSVVNFELLEKTFERFKPDVVIHAAAYKHVPLVEYNIKETIINNIIGTKNVIDTAIKHGAKKFVLISTDKAVRPTNVMGATKRVCELYLQNVISNKTEMIAVRFGNVLGSSGSVIPKFKKQIEEGGPVTVTHPEITRYFMLIPEACELVLQAGSIGKGGEIFILDMGEPVKIVDLAKKMIELSGKGDIEIKFTGLRPGEKLYEELLIDESSANTKYDSITVAKATKFDIEKLNKQIKELTECENIVEKLKEIVPEFSHK